MDQALAWLRDGDMSWAPGTVAVSTTDPACQSVEVAGGRRINLGPDNAMTLTDKEGRCITRSPLQALYFTERGQLQSFREPKDGQGNDRTTTRLIDILTGEASDPFPFTDTEAVYYTSEDLLITYDKHGHMTGCRPR